MRVIRPCSGKVLGRWEDYAKENPGPSVVRQVEFSR